MSFAYGFVGDENIVVVTYSGSITIEEERDSFQAVITDPHFRSHARILVDKRHAKMLATPADVATQVDLVAANLDRLGEPRVAVVVPRDYDFAIQRMFEMHADGRIPHHYGVFRSFDEACEWLGVDQDNVHAHLVALADSA